MPLLVGIRLDRADRAGTDVVDEDVEPAERPYRLRDGDNSSVVVADVGLKGDHRRRFARVAIDDRHARALLRQGLHGCQADA